MSNVIQQSRLKSNRAKSAVAAATRSVHAGIEPLESRQLLAAISVSGTSPIYTQNFSGDTIPSGWLIKETGTAARVDQQAGVGNGSSNAGDVWLFGSSSADRAYGTLFSGTLTPTIGAVFRNDSSQVITSATINYNGEMWRLGTSGREDRIEFGFRVTGGAEPTDPTVGAFTKVPALHFSTPNTSGSPGERNGNVAPYRTENITSELPSLAWAPGEYLVIQWTDFNASGADDGLAVDDFSLTIHGLAGSGPGALVVTPGTVQVNEAAGTVSFNVDRVGGTEGTVSADVLLTPGTAGTSDYGTPSLTTITFADGDDATKTFTVPIIDDSIYEVKETFFVNLTNPQGSAGTPEIGPDATVTIVDNDTPYFKESFELTPGTTYTLEGPVGSSEPPVYEYFGRFSAPDTTNGARDDFTGGFDGNYAIFGQYHDGEFWNGEGDASRSVIIPNIDIAGRENLSAFFSLGAIASEPAFLDNWFATMGISIYASIDGQEKVLIGQFKPQGLAGDLYQDTDLDGQGDGVKLTQGDLQDFAFAIAGTGSSLTLEVEVTSGKRFASWALDNVRVDGALVATGLPAWVAPGSLATWDDNTNTLTVTGATTIIADPGADNAIINASGVAAVVTIDPVDTQIVLSGLNISNSASVVLASVGEDRSPANHRLLIVDANSFSIDATGTLDLVDNDMVLRNASSATESLVAQLIANAAAGMSWTGTGITSSAAALNGTTALGYALNDGSWIGQFSKFGPGSGAQQADVFADDVLIKYTLQGDADLSGDVNFFDYFYADANYDQPGTRWVTGDMDYDGSTNFFDYFWIDSNYDNGVLL